MSPIRTLVLAALISAPMQALAWPLPPPPPPPPNPCLANPAMCRPVNPCLANPLLCQPVDPCKLNPLSCRPIDPCKLNPASCIPIDPCKANPLSCTKSACELHPEWCRPGLCVSGVDRVERRLRALGYDVGPIDCWLDDTSRAAVRAFQRSHGLVVDGDPGPRTRAALGL